MEKKDIGIMYAFIAIRVFILFLSTKISSNIMNQIYTERVLINGEEPPQLRYQLYLFVIIDIVLNLFLIAFIYGVSKFEESIEASSLRQLYVSHYVITLLVIFLLTMIMADTMYKKKYFLYKDDGLRAIRALNDLMFNTGLLISLMPVFYLLNSNKSGSAPNLEKIKANAKANVAKNSNDALSRATKWGSIFNRPSTT